MECVAKVAGGQSGAKDGAGVLVARIIHQGVPSFTLSQDQYAIMSCLRLLGARPTTLSPPW